MAIDTDLALEAVDGDIPEDGRLTDVTAEKRREDAAGLTITETRIGPAAEKRLGKPRGLYVTLEAKEPLSEWSPCFAERTEAAAAELERVSGGRAEKVLFIGLGNRQITADSLGSLAADGVLATRHLRRFAGELDLDGLADTSVLAAGVMAQTGLESAELAKAVCEAVRPELVIVCDALACGEPERMGRSVQITSAGIAPGSGVENSRAELSAATLGVPVTAVGVPTVSRLMKESGMIITPKPIDRLAARAAALIAAAVNRYLYPSLSHEDIISLM